MRFFVDPGAGAVHDGDMNNATTANPTTTGTWEDLEAELIARGGVLQPGRWWLLPDGSRAHVLGGPMADGEQLYRFRTSAPRAKLTKAAIRLCRACGVEVATHGAHCPSCI